MDLPCILTQRFPASHLVKDHRIHLLEGLVTGAHYHFCKATVYDHLGAEETGPDLRQFPCIHLEASQIQGASPCLLASLDECIHLGMHAPATLIV
jgi:hypothetical protein